MPVKPDPIAAAAFLIGMFAPISAVLEGIAIRLIQR